MTTSARQATASGGAERSRIRSFDLFRRLVRGGAERHDKVSVEDKAILADTYTDLSTGSRRR
jgi:hypothetical protein